MASSEEDSLEERQENEVEVLRSIYDRDFEDIRNKDVWKVRRPPEICLKLHPDHDSRGINAKSNDGCSVDLHIKCCENYPKEPPTIDLINPSGKQKSKSNESRTPHSSKFHRTQR